MNTRMDLMLKLFTLDDIILSTKMKGIFDIILRLANKNCRNVAKYLVVVRSGPNSTDHL